MTDYKPLRSMPKFDGGPVSIVDGKIELGARPDLIKEDDRPYLDKELVPPFDIFVCLGPSKIPMNYTVARMARDPGYIGSGKAMILDEIRSCLEQLCGDKTKVHAYLDMLVEDESERYTIDMKRVYDNDTGRE